MQQAKVLRLDQNDPEVLPATNTKNSSGCSRLPPKPRVTSGQPDVLAAQIDEMLIPEREKRRLRMEGGIEDVDIIEILENVSQEES